MAETDSDGDFQSADEGAEDIEDKWKPPMISVEPNILEVPKLENLTIEGSTDGDELFKPKVTAVPRPAKLKARSLGATRLSSSIKQNKPNDVKKRERIPLRIESKIKADADKNFKLEQQRLEDIAKAHSLEAVTNPENDSGYWGWKSWSNTLISTAAYTVSNIKNQVGQGIETVMETVESTFDIPTPRELALQSEGRKHESDKNEFFPPEGEIDSEDEFCQQNEADSDQDESEDEEKRPDKPNSNQKASDDKLLKGVSALTKAIGSTGNTVMQCSLDTLELLGKKTISMITEEDPQSKKKKLIIGGNETISLSEALNEVKGRNSSSLLETDAKQPSTFKEMNFFDLLTKFSGLDHVDALNSLAKFAKKTIEEASMLPEEYCKLSKEQEFITTICKDLPTYDDLDDVDKDHDFEYFVEEHISALNFSFTAQNLINNHVKNRQWIQSCRADLEKNKDIHDIEEIYSVAMVSLVRLTAAILEHFNRIGQFLSQKFVCDEEKPAEETMVNYANILKRLAVTLLTELEIESLKFSHLIDLAVRPSDDSNKVNSIITSISMETSHGYAFIQDCFQLLVPLITMNAIPR